MMKLNEGWVLTKLQDEYVAVPVDASACDFSGVVRLNESGRDIWEGLAQGLTEDDIAREMIQKYDGVSLEDALKDVREVTDKLLSEGILKKE
ncbi:MAG: PqqD family protein [Clostridia bacterium]|nr:PqqD family protein [Clostridia bacterium]